MPSKIVQQLVALNGVAELPKMPVEFRPAHTAELKLLSTTHRPKGEWPINITNCQQPASRSWV
jgi:hypothetical protein